MVLELLLAHLPVRDDEAQLWAKLAQPLRGLLDRLDAVVQVEGLALSLLLAAKSGLDELLVVLAHERADRATALRRRLDHRDVAES